MADYEDIKVKDLVINNMSQEKFDELKAAGELQPDQIYFTPESDGASGFSNYITSDNSIMFSPEGFDITGYGPILGRNKIAISANTWGPGLERFVSKNVSDAIAIGVVSNLMATGSVSLTPINGGATGPYSIAIGYGMQTGYNAEGAIQIGCPFGGISNITNNDANTFKVSNRNGNYEIMSADGTIPTDRYTITPTTAGTYVPKLTIAEDGTATREWGAESGGAGGDFLPLSGGTLTGDLNVSGTNSLKFDDRYVFKSAGSNSGRVVFGAVDSSGYFNQKIIFSITGYGALLPANSDATLGSLGYIWKKTYTTIINNGADLIVPTEGGTLARLEDLEGLGGLPDQTGNAGKFLTTDGTTASWNDRVLVNVAPAYIHTSIMVTNSASSPKSFSVVIGRFADTTAEDTLALGYGAVTKAQGAIQLNASHTSYTNSDPNTFKVANKNGNFEMMDANGNVPRERLKNLVEVLPTEDNGYVTVKNYGNGYVEITGYTAIGTVGASTGSEVQIDLPAGYTMANANYWVNIAPTSETTMFDFKAEAKARSTTHFMVAYKNEDDTTGLTAAGVYWEVRGMLATA